MEPSTFADLSFFHVGFMLFHGLVSLALYSWWFKGVIVSPWWGPGTKPMKALPVSAIPDFQIAFPCIIQSPNLFLF